MLATLYWLLALELFSLASFPLAYRVFSRLPERGWALSKPLGLLLVGVGTWGIGLSHLITNSRLSVALALAVVLLLSWRAARGRTGEMRAFLRAHLNLVVSTELLFIAAFLGVAVLRAAVSDITGTEQPMDLMFLNSTVTSPYYPPNDAWLAGEAVSYYYMGYLFMGALTLFTGLTTPVAYNLGLATAAGLGGVAAFGLTFNLVRLARGSLDGAILGGIAAAFLLLVASNLSGALELGRAAGAGDAAFWESVGIKDLTAPAAPASSWYPEEVWWWWRASRVSTVLNGQELAITEFPLFSFVLGDMHPHVMSMGFLLLAAALAVQVYLLPDALRARTLVREWPLALATVAVVGALGAINMWDLPVGFVMLAGALMLNAARHERTMGFGAAVAMSGGTAIVGAPHDPDAAPAGGSAFVYVRGPKRWRRDARLGPADPHAGAAFGTSVAFDGTLAVVGAPSASTGSAGAAYIFAHAGERWVQLATLRAPDGALEFGRSVAVDGGSIAVGARRAVYVYGGSERTWSLGAEVASEAASNGFGSAVALEQRTLAVGDPESDTGRVHVFTRRGASSWTPSAQLTGPARAFGRSVSVSGQLIAVGAEGVVVVFEGSGQAWEEQAVLRAPETRSVRSFGAAVAVGQRYLAVGAPEANNPAPDSGAAYIYERERARPAWSLHDELATVGAGLDARFGSALAIDGDTVAVGAPGIGQGAAHMVDRVLDSWQPGSKLIARWRFGRAMLAVALLAAAVLVFLAPFLATFQSNAGGILPLRALLTRPLHLLLIWGVSGFLVLPVFFLAMRSVFRRGNWSLMRLGIALFIGFGPVLLWLQPVWGPPFFVVALLFNGLVVMLFGLHQAGYRLPRTDEMVFAINSGVTRVVGTVLLVALLIGDGVLHGERGIDGRFLAVDRLLIVVPMAAVVALSIYGAWTLAHRDSEAARSAEAGGARTAHDGIVPVLLLLAVGSALIMGVELFHVCDTFCGGGDGSLRRMNTVFKLYYQAWLLMAVLGGFGLWYVAGRWDRRVLWGRVGVTAWTAVLVVALGAVSYYPLAAVTTRANDGTGLDLDGQAYLLRSAPDEHRAIQWIRENTPRDAVVIESPVVRCPNEPLGCHSYVTEAARMSGSTGRPTVIGWIGHERQWRSRSKHPELDRRLADVRTIYETEDEVLALDLLRRYEVSYVVVGERERDIYGDAGIAKFGRLGTPVFGLGSGVTIYEVSGGGSA